jgi:hypothetical protein
MHVCKIRVQLATIIRRRARVDLRPKTLISEQLQARYFASNQAILERSAGSGFCLMAFEQRSPALGQNDLAPPAPAPQAVGDMNAALAREERARRREAEARRRAEIATDQAADARPVQARAEAQLAAVLDSTIWRATAPLPNMVRNTRSLRRLLRRCTKARVKT